MLLKRRVISAMASTKKDKYNTHMEELLKTLTPKHINIK